MDEKIIKRSVRWLLDSRATGQKGWGSHWRNEHPSLTVTAEVVSALADAKPHLREVGLLDESAQAITDGLHYLIEVFPTRGDIDLTNIASALIALTRACDCGIDLKSVDVAASWLGCLCGFTDELGHWRPTAEATSHSTFAAYLAMRALYEVMRCQPVWTSLAPATRREIRTRYERTFRFLENTVFKADGRCIDTELPPTSSHEFPAITALGLHFRIVDLSDHNPSLIPVSEAINSCVSYLVEQENLIRDDWTYQLKETHYELCFLPYLIQALSIMVEQLDAPANTRILEFYYRLALFISGDDVLLDQSPNGNPPFWWKRRRTDASAARVWVAAHFLSGIAAIPVARRELLVLVQQFQRLGDRAVARLDAEGLRVGNPGQSRIWLQMSIGAVQATGGILILVLFANGMMADWVPAKFATAILSGVIGGGLLWNYLSRRDSQQPIAVKITAALGLGVAIASLGWQVAFQDFSKWVAPSVEGIVKGQSK